MRIGLEGYVWANVIPVKTGIQPRSNATMRLDPRLRGDDVSNISGPFDDGMRLQEILVHLDTDSGAFQRPHRAVLRELEGRAGELVAEEVRLRHVALEVAAVVDGGEEMDARRHVAAGHRGVR